MIGKPSSYWSTFMTMEIPIFHVYAADSAKKTKKTESVHWMVPCWGVFHSWGMEVPFRHTKWCICFWLFLLACIFSNLDRTHCLSSIRQGKRRGCRHLIESCSVVFLQLRNTPSFQHALTSTLLETCLQQLHHQPQAAVFHSCKGQPLLLEHLLSSPPSDQSRCSLFLSSLAGPQSLLFLSGVHFRFSLWPYSLHSTQELFEISLSQSWMAVSKSWTTDVYPLLRLVWKRKRNSTAPAAARSAWAS